MIQEETDHSKTRPETSGHHHHNNNNNASKRPSSSSTSTSAAAWSRFKDPRVVRVSKALGGKDRHSKVCTVRGLRDRRVRLSVPTAIQLYDLQERLGLNQPSKAVDWLLNVAKNEIDELPPLQIPPGMLNFGENYNNNNNNNNNNLQPISGFQDFYRGKSKVDRDENSWARNQEENNNNNNHNHQALLLNSAYNSIFRLDPSNLSLSQAQHEDWHNNFGLSPFQPTTTHHHVPSVGSSHQVIVYHHHHQPEMSTQSYFPSSGGDHHQFDPKQVNNFQNVHDHSTSQQPVICRPIHFNMTANLLPSQDNNDDDDDKYR